MQLGTSGLWQTLSDCLDVLYKVRFSLLWCPAPYCHISVARILPQQSFSCSPLPTFPLTQPPPFRVTTFLFHSLTFRLKLLQLLWSAPSLSLPRCVADGQHHGALGERLCHFDTSLRQGEKIYRENLILLPFTHPAHIMSDSATLWHAFFIFQNERRHNSIVFCRGSVGDRSPFVCLGFKLLERMQAPNFAAHSQPARFLSLHLVRSWKHSSSRGKWSLRCRAVII